MSALTAESYTIETYGLRLHRKLSQDEWIRLGSLLRGRLSGTQWAIGDWLHYGAELDPKMGRPALDDINSHLYETAMYLTGLSRDTLARRVAVSKAWPIEDRFRELTYNMHRATASLPNRKEILWRVLREEWTFDKLQLELRQIAETSSSTRKRTQRLHQLRCPGCGHVADRTKFERVT